MLHLLATLTTGLLALGDSTTTPRGDSTTLRGDYLEVRTCDLFATPTAKGESGREATLAWKIASGSWEGVNLSGLSAVAIVEAKWTLGDPDKSPLPIRNVLLFDEKTSNEQLSALRSFVKHQLGALLGTVVEERTVPMQLTFGTGVKKGSVKLAAGDVVRVETRRVEHADDDCGGEKPFFGPFTSLADSLPSFTLEHSVKETLLFHKWTDLFSRSAFVGSFEVKQAPAAKPPVDPESV